MAASPTPSLDSIRGTNSVESYGDHNGYLSDSPLTISRSSPPECDSAICEDFTANNNTNTNQHHAISVSASLSSSSSSSSGLSGCSSFISSTGSGKGNKSPGVIGSNLNIESNKGSQCSNFLLNTKAYVKATENNINVARCTACKSTQLNAVAKCFDCVSYLCSNCVTAHEFMHCFNSHSVCLMTNPKSDLNSSSSVNNHPLCNDPKVSSSLALIVQQKHNQMQLSHLSKIVLNSAALSEEATEKNGESPLRINNSVGSNLGERGEILESSPNSLTLTHNPLFCHRHKNELIKYNCRTCCSVACTECVLSEHPTGLHEVENIQEHSLNSNLIFSLKNNPGLTTKSELSAFQSFTTELRGRLRDIVNIVSNADSCISKIKTQYQKAYNDINETYQFFCTMLEERKHELLKELETLFDKKISSNSVWLQRSKDLIEKTIQTCEALERSPKSQDFNDVHMLRKALELQLQAIVQDMQIPFELEFISNYQTIQSSVRNAFGCIRSLKSNVHSPNNQKQPPIARPSNINGSTSGSSISSASSNSINIVPVGLGLSTSLKDNAYLQTNTKNGSMLLALRNNNTNFFDDTSNKPFQTTFANSQLNNASSYSNNPYEKWSNGCSDNIFSISNDSFPNLHIFNSLNQHSILKDSNSINLMPENASSGPLTDLTSKSLAAFYPPKSQIKRQKMIYHCKFGEFGVMEGQFTEPSGVAVNAQNDIIVADTNNHRIQIFDKEGRFKFQFGECGKRDSQLLYPNRVAVVRSSGDIIVTERSPTHQIQIYNQYGQFVRKFGANILQHPRGVTVDSKGRIIVVECKVMRVIIFDQNGNVLHKFGCSKHLEFPNGVVVNDKQEIFISDNRAHCVKVFNYEGQFLRQIGGEGVTNYPIGVGINNNGEILIADNHNNFNLTIFTQNGHLISALESKVKHAQCFDVSLMDDGSVVLASKDYRLYIYRYVQVPSVGL